MRAYKVTVNSTAAVLVAADDLNRNIYFHVVGNKKVAIGSETVTFANGFLIEKHTAPIEIFLPNRQTLYAICDTGETDDVRILIPDSD